MKLGFNEATALECKGQSLMADTEMCEKYGFDYIEIRFDCVKDYLKEHTLEELADWFKNHHLKPWAYNTLIFFNQRDEAGEKKSTKRLILSCRFQSDRNENADHSSELRRKRQICQ